ncbi:zf-HC2 domain-containing protein [Micromonospora sp. WMMD1102]|uniref:zf-HC2 domain-containing protein n=1 Tax=Micromonospora sp. WMMD1102 TaxID=3016105 RepID=UPI00241594D9|nr:zf-HC2 domain-containing protein [Micromonospora sp. WMMD1102]MDG4785897.1 zf-HC2 domain-containing protein [Micromonospora sp. WMMD1102]
MSAEIHWDVASYALGVLDERDTVRFEEHLASCPQCGLELESLLPVAEMLGEVDGRDLMIAERAESDGLLFERVAAAVGADRRRARSRRLYSLAAGVVLVAMLTGLALFAGTRFADPGTTTAKPPQTGTSASPGAGGRPSPTGERFTATDPTSGVKMEVVLGSTAWGTRIWYSLSGLSGPKTCRLVLLHKNGQAEALSSWKVPRNGYGTAAQPNPLMLETATFAGQDDIDRIQVQVIDDDGTTEPLVTVPA